MDIKDYEREEFCKRNDELVLIASENYPKENVLEACGSLFSLKYAEGHIPDENGKYRRYYNGCKYVDKMETACVNACLDLFVPQKYKNMYMANVQSNSGASANMVVYNAVLQPGDTVIGMDVSAGGHLTHSSNKNFIAKYHNLIPYGLDKNGIIDYEQVEELTMEHKPKLIICGASNYSQEIDFARFKNIANRVGALLMADIAHISALVAHGLHQSPVGYADFITFTTHKMLRGARGGVIIYKKEFDKDIRLSTIPGLFGGPLENQIYGKLAGFNYMLSEEGKEYTHQILKNTEAMARTFKEGGIPIVSGSTVNHLMTLDLTDFPVTGKEFSNILEECGIIANMNSIPNDKRSFLQTSGVRLGTPAITARGLKEEECTQIARGICRLLWAIQDGNTRQLDIYKSELHDEVTIICRNHPLSDIYPNRYKMLFNEVEQEV